MEEGFNERKILLYLKKVVTRMIERETECLKRMWWPAEQMLPGCTAATVGMSNIEKVGSGTVEQDGKHLV